jgi:hypothetical protein
VTVVVRVITDSVCGREIDGVAWSPTLMRVEPEFTPVVITLCDSTEPGLAL